MNLSRFSKLTAFAFYIVSSGFLSATDQSDDISFVRSSPVKPQLNTQDLQASSGLPKPEKESSSVLIQASASRKSSEEAWNQVCIEECRRLKMEISKIESNVMINVKGLTQRTREQFYKFLDEYEAQKAIELETPEFRGLGSYDDHIDRMRGGFVNDDDRETEWYQRGSEEWDAERRAERAQSDIDIQNLTSYVNETLIKARSAIPVMIKDLVYHQIDQDNLPSWVLPCIGDPRILDHKKIWSIMAKSLEMSLVHYTPHHQELPAALPAESNSSVSPQLHLPVVNSRRRPCNVQ